MNSDTDTSAKKLNRDKEDISRKIRKAYLDLASNRASSRLSHYLKGKEAIIVGPDTSILGLRWGSRIQEYDTVVRINTALNFVPFKKSLQTDIGQRTDIFYLAPSSMKWAARQGDGLIPYLKQSKNRFICYQNGNDKKCKYLEGPYIYAEQKEQIKKLIIGSRKQGTKQRVETQLSGARDSCLVLCNLLSELKGESMVTRTGLLALWDLLVHGASKVTLLGMSFYHGGGHMFRVIPEGRPLDPSLNHLGQRSPHDSHIEVEFLKLLMDLFPGKIILEAPLNTLFKGMLGEPN